MITCELGKFLGHGGHIPVLCSISEMNSCCSEQEPDARAIERTQEEPTEKLIKQQELTGKRKSQE